MVLGRCPKCRKHPWKFLYSKRISRRFISTQEMFCSLFLIFPCHKDLCFCLWVLLTTQWFVFLFGISLQSHFQHFNFKDTHVKSLAVSQTSPLLMSPGIKNTSRLSACSPFLLLELPCLLLSTHSKNSPENKLEKDLFTAAWRALPLLAGGCWFCPQTPAWRDGCPAGPADGPSLPVAIWIWATWTCDKKQKPWWGGRPSLNNKLKNPVKR